MRNQTKKRRKEVGSKTVLVFLLSLSHLFAIGQRNHNRIQLREITGYCVYTFSYDSVFQFYYPIKSQFVDSASRKVYSLIKRSNLEEYSKACGKVNLSSIGETELYFNQYAIVHDSDFVNTYLQGRLYIDIQTKNIIAAFKIEGEGIIIRKPCRKYLKNFRVNYHKKKAADICHDFLKPPQLFINNVKKAFSLTAAELEIFFLKGSLFGKIKYYICI